MLANQLSRPAQVRESALAGVVMLLICFAAYNTFYAPKKAEVAELQETLAAKQAELKAYETENQGLIAKQQRENQLLALQSRVAVDNDADEKLLHKFRDPEHKTISAFLASITRPGFRGGVAISSLKYNAAKPGDGFAEIGFELVTSGPYGRVVDYVDKILRVQSLVSIDTLQINSAKDDSNLVSLTVTGVFYELRDSGL